jgi:DNA topoisomerase-1
LEAYCFKCKAKREMQEAQPGYNKAGAPMMSGICPVCGGKLFRLGRTPEHDELPKPEVARAPRKETKRKNGRTTKLVIVESPAKARTIGRFLGKEYTVRASVGHVRDLLRSELSVDVENGFHPKYRVLNEKRPIVKELKALVGDAQEVYLATDPDREGEAIAWHLMEAVGIPAENSQRVVFHEITQPAITEAFAHPRQINMDLVNAQQARRILDRLVGYSISPLLWEKVRSRLSAGRVQSVALRMVVEREREIEAFVSEEYWTLEAELCPQGHKSGYVARLVRLDEEEAVLKNQAQVEQLLPDIEGGEFVIEHMKRSERRRKPQAPFITSTMQQEASTKLGFTARRTMAVAQQLYEGLEVGEGGATGLITYMRTDSTQVSEIAQNEARALILERYGNDYLPSIPPQYRTRAVSAQEAHEAIRPTSVRRLPEQVKPFLTPEQFKLYQLVWQRFVASQMEAAVFDALTVEIETKAQQHHYLWRASGATLRFPGFLVVYVEGRDEDKRTEEDDDVRIPVGLEEGQKQILKRLLPTQHFTQPPPRYSEASLVQVLEENGIGRPSTYAPILSTIQERGYVVREGRRLLPTETGVLVNDLMVQYFPDVVNLGFTATMEMDLDQVAEGQRAWVDVVDAFYRSFAPTLQRAQQEIPVTKAELEKVGRNCPDCGRELVFRWGRYGKFISCSGFPECRHTEPFLQKIGVICPEDGGELVERKTRKGRVFYGCSNYPACNFTSWKRPVAQPCPKCGGLLVVSNKRELQCMRCEETFLMEQVLETV